VFIFRRKQKEFFLFDVIEFYGRKGLALWWFLDGLRREFENSIYFS
jgi:hypothetical protein